MVGRVTFSIFDIDGLILADKPGTNPDDRRSLIRDVERGVLVRLRRGAYVEASFWQACNSRERHILRIRAADAAATERLVFARESAAAIWGIPQARPYPDDVRVLVEWPGGGSSEGGMLRTADGYHCALIEEHGGFLVTSLSRTVLDVARFEAFPVATAMLDWSLSSQRSNQLTKAQLVEEFDLWRPRVGSKVLRRSIPFAISESGSFGESRARAVIEQLGFERPVPQARFVDEQGEMFTDFYWPSVNVAAEFDGKTKYVDEQYTGGNPAEALWKEEQREDRLRRQVDTIVRIIHTEVVHPPLLDKLLRDARVPRLGGGEYDHFGRRTRPSAR